MTFLRHGFYPVRLPSVALLLSLGLATASAEPLIHSNSPEILGDGDGQPVPSQSSGTDGEGKRRAIRADVEGILHAGEVKPSGVQTRLEPGLYLVMYPGKESATFYMLVDKYVNDPDKVIAVLFPDHAFHEEDFSGDRFEGKGRIFVGRPIGGSNQLMLSPVTINRFGLASVTSELNAKAPVILVQRKEDEYGRKDKQTRLPYQLQGMNDALREQGGTMEMRAAVSAYPELLPHPASSRFAAADEAGNKRLIVSDRIMTLYDHQGHDSTFQMIDLNGDLGKFAGLAPAALNAQAERYEVTESYKQFAVFINKRGGQDGERILIATPIVGSPTFECQIDMYRIAPKRLMDKWFAGPDEPKSESKSKSKEHSKKSKHRDNGKDRDERE